MATMNWPFARIHNDFPSAAVLRGAGTLAGSGKLETTSSHTHTHSYTVKPLSYMVKPKSTNLSDTQLHKFTHGFTHIMHKLSESRPVSSSPAVLFQVKKPLLFPFTFASCWSREESFSRVSQSLSLSLSSSCSAASQHNLTQNTCVEACAQLCVSARVYFCL